MKQLSEQEAIEFAENGKWKNMSDLELAYFQINQVRLAVPFDEFHQAVKSVLGHPVFTHQFVTFHDEMLAEINQKAEAAGLK